jgi:hypothetical protein
MNRPFRYLHGLVRYFDIASDDRVRQQGADGGPAPKLYVAPQWIALVLGVLVQPFLATYQKTGHWQFNGAIAWLPAALLIAIVIFPSVYRNSFDPSKPWIVQIIPLFTAGLGWNALFSAAVPH